MASGLSYAHLNAACVTDPALADIDKLGVVPLPRSCLGALLPPASLGRTALR